MIKYFDYQDTYGPCDGKTDIQLRNIDNKEPFNINSDEFDVKL